MPVLPLNGMKNAVNLSDISRVKKQLDTAKFNLSVAFNEGDYQKKLVSFNIKIFPI